MKTIVGVALSVAAFAAAPVARADVPGINDLICSQLALGASPGDLARALHAGGPQWSVSQYYATILNEAGYC
jgi:hypothetical protein